MSNGVGIPVVDGRLGISGESTSVSPGQGLTVSWKIANIGDAQASATSTTVVRINQSASRASGENLQLINTSALAAGSSEQQNATVNAPTAPGRYYVWIIADNFSTVANQNNTFNDLQPSGVFTVTGASADLVPQNIELSTGTVAPGDINQSAVSAGPKINSAAIDTPALAAGQPPMLQTATLTAPSTPGTYYVWVIADNFSNVTNQTDVTNDLKHSAAFRVTGQQISASFQRLGFLPGGNHSQASGVSANGAVVVGTAWDGQGALS